jgi:hypothetical protein
MSTNMATSEKQTFNDRVFGGIYLEFGDIE